MNILVTGGLGFIGSNFIRFYLKTHPNDLIINLDKITYAGNPDNLKDLKEPDVYRFVKGDIADPEILNTIFTTKIDIVINFAAETHVDRSIDDPAPFLRTNVNGTQNLLEYARKNKIKRFVQISTDEVYGSLGPEGLFTEESFIKPNSPYAASKAAADLLVRAYHETFGLDVVITRCSNNYGPYQFPEKLIPHFITNAMAEIPLPIYGDGLNVRDWIHVEDHCRGIDLVVHKGVSGEVYNIGGSNELTNLEITDRILKILNKPHTLKKYVKDRLGHDRRYAIDSTKIRKELSWEPVESFEEGLNRTVAWYKNNREWIKGITNN